MACLHLQNAHRLKQNLETALTVLRVHLILFLLSIDNANSRAGLLIHGGKQYSRLRLNCSILNVY